MTATTAVSSVLPSHRRRRLRFDVGVALSVAVLAGMAIVALLAPLVAPHDPYRQSLVDALLAPGSTGGAGFHLMGTDELGRDTLSRLLYGIRPVGLIALVSVTASALIGSSVGLISGFSKGWLDSILMRLADVQLSVPPIVLAIILAVALRPGVTTAILAISLVTWPQYARVVRAEAMRVGTSDYVRLARVAGLKKGRLLAFHVVPNVLNIVIVLATLNLSIAIIFSAALSFLGVGVQAPTPDWGNMLAAGSQYLQSWWMVVFPGLAITVTVLALNIVGDHVRDRMDPRLAERPADEKFGLTESGAH